MIYLLDTSGLVRLFSDTTLQSTWSDAIEAGAVARHAPDLGEHSVHDVA